MDSVWTSLDGFILYWTSELLTEINVLGQSKKILEWQKNKNLKRKETWSKNKTFETWSSNIHCAKMKLKNSQDFPCYN